MAILKIARMGHPVLRHPAKPVADPGSADVRRLVDDMLETLEDADGVGLAAPQVHASLRIILVQPSPEPDEPVEIDVLVNPEIEPVDEVMEPGLEGCLSIPGIRGIVPRHRRVRYRGVGLDGEPVAGVAEGFHARVLQHEVDHLDGILFPMRMPDLGLLSFESELRHLVPGTGRETAEDLEAVEP